MKIGGLPAPSLHLKLRSAVRSLPPGSHPHLPPFVRSALGSPRRKSGCIRPALHPTWRRCSSLNGALFNERIHQLDLKLSKSFRVNRVTLAGLEIFNVYNADTIVAYVSRALNSPSYGRGNSFVQGRMIGVGTTVR